MEREELQAIASQLKNPSGEKGIEMGNMMNETNINMTKHSIQNLNISAANKILELGHGNAGHVEFLFEQAKEIEEKNLLEMLHKFGFDYTYNYKGEKTIYEWIPEWFEEYKRVQQFKNK